MAVAMRVSGLGSYDKKVYAELISGENAERVEIGWTIMYRTSSSELGAGKPFKWRLGFVERLSTTSGEPGDVRSAIVRFPSVEDASEFRSTVVLSQETFGDGTAEGHNWFRVIKRTDLVAHQKASRERAVVERLRGVLGRVLVPEEPCGQCGHRAIGRSLAAESGNRVPDDRQVSSVDILASRKLIGESLIKNAVTIAGLITYCHHRTRQQSPEALAESVRYLANRGQEVQLVRPDRPCVSKDWFGGRSGCDAIAASMGTGKSLFVITEGQISVNVFEPTGTMRYTSIGEMNPSPSDIVIESVWRGTHFVSWVVPLTKSQAEITAETAAAAARAAAARAASVAASRSAVRTRAATAAAAATILEAAAAAAARQTNEASAGPDEEDERIKKAKLVDARQKMLDNLPSSEDLLAMYTRVQQWKDDVLKRGKQGRY